MLLTIVIYNVYLCLVSATSIWSWLFTNLKTVYLVPLLVGDLGPPVIALYTYLTSNRNMRRLLFPKRIPNDKAMKAFTYCKNTVRVPKKVELWVIDSDLPPAFTFGDKGSSVVVVTRELVERLSPEELQGVLGHELSHVRNGDDVIMTWYDSLVHAYGKFLPLYLAVTVLNVFLDVSMGFGNPLMVSVRAFVTLIMIFVFPTLLINSFSRAREYTADLAGYFMAPSYPTALIASDQLKYLKPFAGYERLSLLPTSGRAPFTRLLTTHPTLRSRIDNLSAGKRSIQLSFGDAVTIGVTVAIASVILIEVILSSIIYSFALIPSVLPLGMQAAAQFAMTLLIVKYFEFVTYILELMIPAVVLYVTFSFKRCGSRSIKAAILEGIGYSTGLTILPIYFLLPEQGVSVGGPFPIPKDVWPTGGGNFSSLFQAATAYFIVLILVCLIESLVYQLTAMRPKRTATLEAQRKVFGTEHSVLRIEPDMKGDCSIQCDVSGL